MWTFARKPKTIQPNTSATPTMLSQAVKRQSEENTRDVKDTSTNINPACVNHDFSRIPIHTPVAGAIQTKLAINKPGDSYEQEADRVADKMMSMPEPQLQRACACGGECPKCGNQQAVQEQIQTKPAQGHNVGEATAPPSVENVMSSPGQPLDSTTRAFFEPRFGQDFSQVRVHTDTPAVESAKAVNAQAYTLGSHIVFGQREYAPKTQGGLRLLAHELTHVVQQGAQRRVIQRKEPPDSTNYAFDTYRVTESHLSDPDIVARFKALSLSRLIEYRNRVNDLAVIDYIEQLLNERLSAQTLDQLFADLKTEQDPAVRTYIDQWLATNAPTSYEIAVGANKAGGTETAMTANGISVKVLPDEFVDDATFKSLVATMSHGKGSDITKGITIYDPKWQPHWVIKKGKVSSVRPSTQELKLKTVFPRGTSRITQSGYGVGTSEADKTAGRTTLAHHEGSHAICFIQYLRDKAPPIFDGKVGDTEAEVQAKAQTFQAAMEKYYTDMVALCGDAVDCTATKAPFCP